MTVSTDASRSIRFPALRTAYEQIASVVGHAPFLPRTIGADEVLVLALVGLGLAKVEQRFPEPHGCTYRLLA